MDTIGNRKAELERKKARLQAIRDEKARKLKEEEQKDVGDNSRLQEVDKKPNKEDLDDVLSSLGVASVSDVFASLSSASPRGASENSTPDTSLLNQSMPHSESRVPQIKRSPPELSVVTVQQTNILPKELERYTKQTQTHGPSTERDVLTFDDIQAEDEDSSLPSLEGGIQYRNRLPPGIFPHGLPRVKEVQPAVTPGEEASAAAAARQQEEPQKAKELTEEEKQVILLSDDFRKFFFRASGILEKALTQDGDDVFVDYIGGPDGEDGGEDRLKHKLSLSGCFTDDRWSRDRCVTSYDWCHKFPELLLASYHNNENAPHEPDGVCLVWNTKFKSKKPEFIFHCQSAVTSAKFAKFHPNLFLGGTYSGQIMLWDNRVQKRTPIQRSPLSTKAHAHPVYCLSLVGTQNSHNLISVSTDGRLCSWSLDMLSEPQETLSLQYKQSKSITATCLAFLEDDVNNFILGSEEGHIYAGCRHGNVAGINEVYEGHHGSITGVSTPRLSGNVDFTHLILSSSLDWTVKLWDSKENRFIYSFENYSDYVYDVAWSPIHPAVFATVDGTGKLDLWNLNRETEVPIASVTVEGNPSLSRVSWMDSGLTVAVGDYTGKTWLYDIAEQYAIPRSSEWAQFSHTLQELQNNIAGEENDRYLGSVADSGYASPAGNYLSLGPTTTPIR